MKLSLTSTTLFVVFSICTLYSNAQSLSAGFDFGGGASYIVEHLQNDSYTNYSGSITASANVKFTPKDSYFGLRLNLLSVNTLFESNIPFWGIYTHGEVSSTTTSILLEHLSETKKWNLGYHFGLGYTNENYHEIDGKTTSSDIRNFMSLTVGGILAYQVSERSSINLTPSVLWTDPINTLRSDNWQHGREDISAFIQLGYTYRFK